LTIISVEGPAFSSNPDAGTDLMTVGYGKSKLKDSSNPLADVNRRVQVVNMENKATASK
jgi:flagellar motor protein MotB